MLFKSVFQRPPAAKEIARVKRFVAQQNAIAQRLKSTNRTGDAWTLVAQALLMSNEFQYVD